MQSDTNQTESWCELFNLGASEICARNKWTKEFLPGWTDNKIINKEERISHREIMITDVRSKYYFDLVKSNIVHENEQVDEAGKLPVENRNEVLHKGDLRKKCYELLATYSCAQPREITYYENYYIAREDVKQIIRIHERMHAYHHVNMYGVWDNFANTSCVYLEFLAQLFTFKCVENTHLEYYFRQLSKRQPYIYQTWELAKELSKKEVNDLYTEIKKLGGKNRFELDLLAAKYEEAEKAEFSAAEIKVNDENTSCGKTQPVRLTQEHDEFYKDHETFNPYRINSLISETLNEIW